MTTLPTPNDQALARMRRKADQEWEMAGLARLDRDMPAAEKHAAAAQEWERMIKEQQSGHPT